MKKIQLSDSKFAIVDDEDFERLSQYRWHARKGCKTWYARVSEKSPHTPTRPYMHRMIMNPPAHLWVDHIDGNGLNNQKSNLRICTRTQNLRNRGKNKNNTSGYKGVVRFQGKWRAVLGVTRNGIARLEWLGDFDDPITAAHEYDRRASELHGAFANLNFPDLPIGTDSPRKSQRRNPPFSRPHVRP